MYKINIYPTEFNETTMRVRLDITTDKYNIFDVLKKLSKEAYESVSNEVNDLVKKIRKIEGISDISDYPLYDSETVLRIYFTVDKNITLYETILNRLEPIVYDALKKIEHIIRTDTFYHEVENLHKTFEIDL